MYIYCHIYKTIQGMPIHCLYQGGAEVNNKAELKPISFARIAQNNTVTKFQGTTVIKNGVIPGY